MTNFLRTALNAKIEEREELFEDDEGIDEDDEDDGFETSPMEGNVDEGEVGVAEFQQILQEKMEQLDMDEKFAQRYLNAGFSGGEKKQNEVLQAAILEPSVAVLDEIDSGWTSTAYRTFRTASTRCATSRALVSFRSPTTSASSITSSRITST